MDATNVYTRLDALLAQSALAKGHRVAPSGQQLRVASHLPRPRAQPMAPAHRPPPQAPAHRPPPQAPPKPRPRAHRAPPSRPQPLSVSDGASVTSVSSGSATGDAPHPQPQALDEVPSRALLEERYKDERERNPSPPRHHYAYSSPVGQRSRASKAELQMAVRAFSDSIRTKYKCLHDAFRGIDRDSSGAISVYELERSMRKFNLPVPHEHVMQIAEACANGRGEIDFNVFNKKLYEGTLNFDAN